MRNREAEAKLNKELEFALEKENIIKNDINAEEKEIHDAESEKSI
jgi:hypothetical protein